MIGDAGVNVSHPKYGLKCHVKINSKCGINKTLTSNIIQIIQIF